jgi:hypothetical protein
MYFIQKTQASESIHAHELVHVVQWNALGLRQFLFTYAVGIAQHGYEKSPFEAAAYAVQREFEAGRSIPGLVDTISLHARETQAKAEEVLRHHGLRMT